MNEKEFSKEYSVIKLGKKNLHQIYELCSENSLYYQYCPPFISLESIEEDMLALPPGVSLQYKYYVGYFSGDRLIAVLDLIDGYPEKDAEHFWLKNGFTVVKETSSTAADYVILAERKL